MQCRDFCHVGKQLPFVLANFKELVSHWGSQWVRMTYVWQTDWPTTKKKGIKETKKISAESLLDSAGKPYDM